MVKVYTMKLPMLWPQLFVSLPLIGAGLATIWPIDSRAGGPLLVCGIFCTALIVIEAVMRWHHTKDIERIRAETDRVHAEADRIRLETAELVRQVNATSGKPPGPLIVFSMAQSDFDELKRRAERTNSKIEDVVCDLLRKGAKSEES